jgi:hypothetical protein
MPERTQYACAMTPVSTPLPDLRDVDSFGPADEQILTDVREVLAQHGALQRFGLVLLHQHFPMTDNERLVEFVDTEQRVLTIKPVPIDEANAVNAVPTQWRLDQPTPTLGCEKWCVEDPATGEHMDYGHFKEDDDE